MSNPFDEDYKYITSRSELDAIKSYTTNSTSFEEDVEEYEKEIEKYMQASLDSTQHSCQQLGNSEKLAENTIRELSEQREKLERAEHGLDEIHHTTQLTQRTLNSLKSVFGGFIRNKLTRAPKSSTPNPAENKDEIPASKSEGHLNDLMNKVGSTSVAAASTLGSTSKDYIKGTRWEAMDEQIDQNLDSMSAQLNRLKAFGMAIGQEVDDQNGIIDCIQTKAERNDSTIRSQDSQMRNLLGYKN